MQPVVILEVLEQIISTNTDSDLPGAYSFRSVFIGHGTFSWFVIFMITVCDSVISVISRFMFKLLSKTWKFLFFI